MINKNSADIGNHAAFYKNAAWQYLLTFIKYLLPLVTVPYMTRVLRPEAYSVYAYVASFMAFAQTLIDFGFNLSGTKKVAKAENSYILGKVCGSITQARLLLCVIVGICCCCIAIYIPKLHKNMLYTALAYIAVCGRGLAPDFLFQGKEQMGPLTTRYLVSKGTSTLLTFLFVRSSSDLLVVPLLDIVASSIALMWSFSAAKRLFGLHIIWVDARDVLSELATSGYYCISNMASISFNGLTTIVIGLVINDDAQISYWSLAMSAISAVQSLYSPISNSLYPHMVKRGDFRFAKRIALVSLPFVAWGTFLFAFLSGPIFSILGGQEYIVGSNILSAVSPVLFFSFYGVLFGWPILGAKGLVKQLTMTTLVSAAFGLICQLILCYIGNVTIISFCWIRVFTEALMCLLRGIMCLRALA